MEKSLEKFGINSGHDERHSAMAERQKVKAERFFAEADQLATEITPVVTKEIISRLEEYEGKWNPGGFMVFSLGVHQKLGSVRLHIYPQGIARKTAQGPNIHNHAWHLFSKVLIGPYSDTIYELNREEKRGTDGFQLEKAVFRLFETRRNPRGQDTLVTDGTLVRPIPILKRKIPTGQSHSIEAEKIYHLTTIPATQLAATLVIDSPAFGKTTHVLLKERLQEILRIRKPIEYSQAVLAKKQLLRALNLEK